jgi:two-component system response regulator RegX3
VKYDCLIVDDEKELSESTQTYFEMFGIKTAWAADQKSCIDFLAEHKTDLILLDINLGSSSGFDLCKHLRETIDVPILFISARASDDDVLLALNIGGDDYIQKPYSLAVLLAKVKATLKRYKTANDEDAIFVSGTLKIDFLSEHIFLNEQEINVKPMEYRLLAYLAKNKNRTISKEELFKNVWKNEIVGDNTLNVHIRHLREQIEADANKPRYIKTIWGVGYVFSRSDE